LIAFFNLLKLLEFFFKVIFVIRGKWTQLVV
jgi:hypothetical protein